MEFDIPMLNNMDDAIDNANAVLQSYLDLLELDSVHDPYSIKHSITNLDLCIELFIKYRLMEEHWAFIFEDVNKAKEDDLESGDFVSVNFIRGIERLHNICNITEQFEGCIQLHKLRNKIEHYTLNSSFENVLSILSRSIKEILHFANTQVLPFIENENAITDLRYNLRELEQHEQEIVLITFE